MALNSIEKRRGRLNYTWMESIYLFFKQETNRKIFSRLSLKGLLIFAALVVGWAVIGDIRLTRGRQGCYCTQPPSSICNANVSFAFLGWWSSSCWGWWIIPSGRVSSGSLSPEGIRGRWPLPPGNQTLVTTQERAKTTESTTSRQVFGDRTVDCLPCVIIAFTSTCSPY